MALLQRIAILEEDRARDRAKIDHIQEQVSELRAMALEMRQIMGGESVRMPEMGDYSSGAEDETDEEDRERNAASRRRVALLEEQRLEDRATIRRLQAEAAWLTGELMGLRRQIDRALDVSDEDDESDGDDEDGDDESSQGGEEGEDEEMPDAEGGEEGGEAEEDDEEDDEEDGGAPVAANPASQQAANPVGQQAAVNPPPQRATPAAVAAHFPFRCSVPGCNTLFVQLSKLTKHTEDTHNSNPATRKAIVCPTCSASFDTRKSLLKHGRWHDPSHSAYVDKLPRPGGCPCPVCGHDCGSVINRRDHMSRMHGGAAWRTLHPGVQLD